MRWLRMALPFALDHINLWLLRDRDEDGREGWAIVDCGIANDATRAAWEQVFANELGGLPVLRVIVTHMHPDHMGLAHWLTERWRACGCGSAPPTGTRRGMASQTDHRLRRRRARRRFMASHGLTDPEAVDKIRARSNYYASMVPQVPARYRRLMQRRRAAHRRPATGSATPATAMRRSTSRCIARRSAC